VSLPPSFSQILFLFGKLKENEKASMTAKGATGDLVLKSHHESE